MSAQSGKKDCSCTAANPSPNCNGEHARNLSAAASYLSDNNPIDMTRPKRVIRPQSRSREDSDPLLEYRDPDYRDMYEPARARAYSRSGYRREPSKQARFEDEDDVEELTRSSQGKNWEVDEALAGDIDRLTATGNNSVGRTLVEDSRFQVHNRRPLNKFEAIKHQGEDIRKFTIGGFEINHDVNIREALKVISLPKAKLPRIFTNDILNHYAHFFSGLSEVLDPDEQKSLAEGNLDVPVDVPFIYTKLSGLMSEGYRNTDSESLLFLKNTLVTTFELEQPKLSRFGTPLEDWTPQMTVKASIWGFQYIEEGMRMNEEELRMFLGQNLNLYKMMWNNELKLTKMPYFLAVSSTRSSARSYSSSSSDSRMKAIQESASERDETASISSKHSRRRSSGSSRKSRPDKPMLLDYLSGRK